MVEGCGAAVSLVATKRECDAESGAVGRAIEIKNV